jgi:hypothetical protein
MSMESPPNVLRGDTGPCAEHQTHVCGGRNSHAVRIMLRMALAPRTVCSRIVPMAECVNESSSSFVLKCAERNRGGSTYDNFKLPRNWRTTTVCSEGSDLPAISPHNPNPPFYTLDIRHARTRIAEEHSRITSARM